jgi:hypothetical protein
MPPSGWPTNKLGYSSNSDRRRMMRSGRIGELRQPQHDFTPHGLINAPAREIEAEFRFDLRMKR